jgi:putative zinc finger protein
VPDRDRDRSVENVLRHVLSDGASSGKRGTCPDPETIAAWHEGALRTANAAAVERHVADCPRCRALMAAFIQTAPASAVVESMWRRWHLGWAVPLATAATAAALWIGVPRNTSLPEEAGESRTVAVDAVAPAAPAGTPPPTAAAPSTVTRTESLEAARAFARREKSEPASEQESASKPLEDQRAALPASSARIEADQREDANSAAPQIAATPQAAAAPRAAAALRAAAAVREEVALPEIVAPGGTARWRIVGGQRIERAPGAGGRWAPASIDVSDLLTAGAAPSASVCWIVGRRGAVYVTTDGMRFVRVPFPEMSDLVAVTATDERTAVVSSADGRSWTTADQGRTWLPGR